MWPYQIMQRLSISSEEASVTERSRRTYPMHWKFYQNNPKIQTPILLIDPSIRWSALLLPPHPDSCVRRSAAHCSPPGKDRHALSTPAGAPAHFSPGPTPMGFPWPDLYLRLRREMSHSSSSSNLNFILLISKKNSTARRIKWYQYDKNRHDFLIYSYIPST